MQSSTWKAGLLLALVAIAGGAVGSVVTIQAMHGRHGGGRRGGDWYVELLNHELKLTPAQRDSVLAILARHHNDMDSIWNQFGARRGPGTADPRAGDALPRSNRPARCRAA
jgi:hypothetical protein